MSSLDLRWKHSVGRLLAAIKLMRHFVTNNNVEAVLEIERCFAPDFTYVRKVKVLDTIIRQNARIVFPNTN